MSTRLTGYKELDAVLKRLPAHMSDKVFQAAHVRALVPFVNQEHRLAPVGKTGNLADSIGTVKASARSLGSRGLGAVSAGPRRNKPYKGFAAHLNELGTKIRSTRKGANRGRMSAKPFAEPAWEATKGEVETLAARELGNEVVKFARRILRS